MPEEAEAEVEAEEMILTTKIINMSLVAVEDAVAEEAEDEVPLCWDNPRNKGKGESQGGPDAAATDTTADGSKSDSKDGE
ncbi:hypothetical protein N7539_008696 [Penicillium diatomitis]|uniref:Uncharacterized protein n=1 Tax=Penicillium diatomitis TaxID=2819901 RepID=A0A9W9WRW2_9EURO|nr:uncharacterized protein N7539_008610 [Penicillium diatomitis]XP_056786673.1 uncharacterized protein N7539_008696 [Penicillium diatomitis]KAJ5472041.1 hypothetical protein N7539_008610 [Penicillium diatomitis]KAJ5472127.1 hypothetical protein N7539_008696 [Penicillium diatomitis]